MKKQNSFLSAALESASLSGTIEVGDIHHIETLQPKPGLGKCEFDENDKVTASVGEEHPISEHDEIDTVAESQEATLALEHFTSQIQRHMIHMTALETLVEQIDGNLEAEKPMDPATVAMITTAVDGAGIGAPVADSVALESFDFSAIAATESFKETLKERIGQVADAVSKMGKSLSTALTTRLSSLAAGFKVFPTVHLIGVEKSLEQVADVAGEYFENGKVEKSLMAKFNADSSVRTPLAAVAESLAEYDAVTNFLDTRLTSSVAQVRRAWTEGNFDKVPAAVNKLLDDVSELSSKYSAKSKFAAFKIIVDTTKVTAENATKLNKNGYTRKENTFNFDSRLRIAKVEDAKKLAETAARIGRVYATRCDDITRSILFTPFKVAGAIAGGGLGNRRSQLGDNESSWTAVKVGAAVRYALFMASNAAKSIELASSESVYRNARAAADWLRASVTEGKRQMAKN